MKRLLPIVFRLFSISGNSAVQSEFEYSVSANQNMFSVNLNSNPTTGYQWILTSYDKYLLKLNASQFMASKSRLLGASGVTIFNFSVLEGVKRPQATVIKFVYRRPWESNTGTIKEVTVRFH